MHTVLDKPGFHTVKALEEHAKEMPKRIMRLKRLVATINNTMLYLKGTHKMRKPNLYMGYSETEQTNMQQEAMQLYDPVIVRASSQKWKELYP